MPSCFVLASGITPQVSQVLEKMDQPAILWQLVQAVGIRKENIQLRIVILDTTIIDPHIGVIQERLWGLGK
jgi:hypothetical protein